MRNELAPPLSAAPSSALPKKAPQHLQKVQQVGEAIASVYHAIMNSFLFRIPRDWVWSYTPHIGRTFVWLQKPCSYLKGAAIAGVLACGVQLYRYQKNFIEGAKPRHYIALKICFIFSELVKSGEKVAVALHDYGWTDWMYEKGLRHASAAIKTAALWKGTIGIFVWALTLSKVFIDAAKLSKSQKHLESFQTLHKTPKALEKMLQVKGDKLQACLKDGDKTQVELLRGRIQTIITTKKLILLKDTINLIGTALIFTSFLHPLGYILLGTHIASSIGLGAYRKFTQYQFQHAIGMDTMPDGLATWQKGIYIGKWILSH